MVVPLLTLFAIVVLGGLTVLLCYVLDLGDELGDVVSDANERRQEAAQAGTQGIRDIEVYMNRDPLVAPSTRSFEFVRVFLLFGECSYQ